MIHYAKRIDLKCGNVYNNCRGVTLVELIIVLAIMLVISTAFVSNVSFGDKRALENACATLQGDLRMAQRLSVIEGHRYMVSFDIINNSYVVYAEVGVFRKKIREFKFENGIKLFDVSSSSKEVVYTPTGTTGDPCKITFYSGKYKANLTVNLGSGRIAIKQYIKL